ncbi:MAG: hypothetical protein J2P17_29980 [Mycobacterium sp.]|nr:hypothetical protein [Mycobacterium sp.]
MSSYLVDAQHQSDGFDALQYASDFVRAYCNQRFDFTADEVVLIDPWPNSAALLPEGPVTAVSSVLAWIQTGVGGSYQWQTLTNFGWTAAGLLYDTTPAIVDAYPVVFPSWPVLPQSLKVTYSHGYATIPDDLQSVVLRIAAEIEANPDYAHSEKVGEINTVWANNPVADGSHITLRDQDKWILDRYSRVGIS